MKSNHGSSHLPPSASRLLLPTFSTALEALQPLVLVLAFQLGAMHLVRGHNPISFCNGLLFGNFFSLVALLLIKWMRPRRVDKASLDRVWSWATCFQVLLPVGCNALLEVMLVIALTRVAAVQVSVVLSLGSIVLLLGRCLVLRQYPLPGVWAGVVIVVAGSWLSAIAETSGMMDQFEPMALNLLPDTPLANGFLLLLLLLFSALYLEVSAPLARSMSVLDFGLWQCLLQTVIFLVWATTTYGLVHIYDLESPLLWVVMLLYGAVISTAYTLVEAAALAKSGPLLVSLVGSFIPLFSGVFAFALLQQPLTLAVVIGATVVGLGIVVVELNDRQQQV